MLDFGSDLAHNVDTGIFPLRDTSNAEGVLNGKPSGFGGCLWSPRDSILVYKLHNFIMRQELTLSSHQFK